MEPLYVLEVKDSCLNGQDEDENENGGHARLSFLIQAIDGLRNSFKEAKLPVLSLSDRNESKNPPEDLISYDWIESKILYTSNIPTKIRVYTSHYIGIYQKKIRGTNVAIVIKPRFGDTIFNYLLGYASQIYLPEDAKSSLDNQTDESNPLWLMALLWKGAFDKAVTINHIPRQYLKRERNLSAWKGSLNFTKQLQKNLIDQSRFYCKYREFTADNVINRTIRYSYQLLRNYGWSFPDIEEYDYRLASMGVSCGAVRPKDIEGINYNRMNEGYRLLMDICRMLIDYDSYQSSPEALNRQAFSFFIDVAEIWENYIIALLQRHLGSEYSVTSPNYEGQKEYLLAGEYRHIRPDILVKNTDGKLVAIIDAKYKSYTKLGKTECYDYFNDNKTRTVSSSDLYQMCTYLWHYSEGDKDGIKCIFVAPHEGLENCTEEALRPFTKHGNHSIGIVHLCLPTKPKDSEESQTDIINQIVKAEENFTKRIKDLLTGEEKGKGA